MATKTKKAKKNYRKSTTGKTVWDIMTERLLEAVNGNAGDGDWEMPWRKISFGKGPRNPLSTHKQAHELAYHYTGSNLFIMLVEAMFKGYPLPYWAGPDQIAQAGGELTDGAQPTYILHPIMRTVWDDDPETGERIKKGEYISNWRYTKVFNLTYSKGLDVEAIIAAEEINYQEMLRDNPPIEQAQRIWDNMPNRPAVECAVGINQAAYSPLMDKMLMPDIRQFVGSEQFYQTLFHEAGHSVKHKTRLGPGKAHARMKDKGFAHKMEYAGEEVIAEACAMRVCLEAGIADQVVSNTLAYLKSWGGAIKEDSELVWLAFAEAEARAMYICAK